MKSLDKKASQEIEPIGLFIGDETFKSQAPRQGVWSDSQGMIELSPNRNFEQALKGLEGFQRIWVIYLFHHNHHWKPMVRPQNIDEKVGVFATRAPYRPNQIGMSCVKLKKIEGRKLFVEEHDLLDGTPILDIKPYIFYADSFSEEESLNENCWWKMNHKRYALSFSSLAQEKKKWIEEETLLNLETSIRTQLERKPKDQKRKRVRPAKENWEFSFRTWKVLYSVDEARCQVEVLDIQSAYSHGLPSKDEFAGRENSIEIHRKFIADFDR